MKAWASLKPACAAAALAAAALLPATVAAQQPAGGGAAYAQRFASVCAACHGANGRSAMPLTPALSGQHSFYAITQLFMFREGRRSHEGMTAIAKTLTDADLRGFADYIATLPAVPEATPASAPDAARMARGQALAQENKCFACHGADLSGGQQVPRIAQQREDYLQLTLQEFKSGKRPGYTMAMGEAVGRIPVEDLDTLAYFIARFAPAAPAAPAKKK